MKLYSLLLGGLAALTLGTAQAGSTPIMDSDDLGEQAVIDYFDPGRDDPLPERAQGVLDMEDVERAQAYVDPFDPQQEPPEPYRHLPYYEEHELAGSPNYPFDPIG